MRKMLVVAIVVGCVAGGRGAQFGTDVHVTLHEGTNMAAAMSPDGRTIAIDLLGTLWTLPAGGGKATPITDIFMDARQPSWSPDSRRIAFQAYYDSNWHIWTINADGTDLKPVTDGPFDDREPAWSPDGARIAFSSDRNGTYDVWVLTLASGDVRPITGPGSGDTLGDAERANEFAPTWRSRTQVGYVSDRKPAGIYLRTLDRPGSAMVMEAGGSLGTPAFGPDRFVAFSVVDRSTSRLLVGEGFGQGAIPTASQMRNIAGADEDVFPFRPQWLASGDLFYTADGKIKRRPSIGGTARTIEFTADVSFERPAFTAKRHVFDLPGPQPARGIVHSAISPDGAQVAFAALGDIWLMPLDGPARRITRGAPLETEPAWSPNGTTLAFASDRDGTMNIWVRDLASGTERKVTQLASAAMSPAWSHDGDRIAFTDAEGQVQVVNLLSGIVTKIHDRLNEPGRPSWSLDGSYVVVSALHVYSSRFREGTNQVLRISTKGEPDAWFDPIPHKSIGMREDYGPVWSPDGSQMAAIVDGLLVAWPVTVDGHPEGQARVLSTDLAGTPSWTGDSKHILYQTDRGLRIVDILNRRAVREIDPNVMWTQTHPTGTKTIHAGRFWNGKSDGIDQNVDIVIEGNHIASVGPHGTHAGDEIDASADTVIPGLIEIHSHVSTSYGQAVGRGFLSWGITTVRNPAANTRESMEHRESYESGERIGPRIITTGEPFDGTRIYYPGGASIGDSGQLPMQLQHAKDFGYDFVKTYVRLPDLMQKRVIEAAHAMGMPVTSHELYPAVAFGADGVEHIRGTSRRGYSPKISLLSRSYQDVIDLLTASKMTLTPTVGIQGAFRLQTLLDKTWIEDPRIQAFTPRSVIERWKAETRVPPPRSLIEELQRQVRPQERTIFQVVRGGGRVVAGTDAPINPYGLSLLMELESYASAGLTPLEVLRTATLESAEAMGVGADIGSIEPGKLADLAFIDGDPLTNVKDLRRVRRVMKDGNLYEISALISRR